MHKTNVLVHAGALWSRVVAEVGAEFPDVTVDYLHVDAATIFLTTDPARFDVIVTDNLFGDILTDLAAAVTGGIGLAASGNINPERTTPSMFEPVHGSAPDIAGQGSRRPDRGDPLGGPPARPSGLPRASSPRRGGGDRGRRGARARSAPVVLRRSATPSPPGSPEAGRCGSPRKR